MTTEEIIELDCSKPDGVKKLKVALSKVKPISKYKDVDINKLQECMCQLQARYHVDLQYATFMFSQDKDSYKWSASIRGSKDGKWMGNIYALTLWELMAKIVVKMYSVSKKGEVPKR